MKQQEHLQELYNNYLNAPNKKILDCYDRPSIQKIRIEANIIDHMHAQGGSGYKVLSHNIRQFTCAYIIKEKNQLIYLTRDYVRVIDLNNFKLISKESGF